MTDKVGIVILAAGAGTRMKRKEAKPLVPLMGRRLIDFPLRSALQFSKMPGLDASFHLVTGHQREQVEEYILENYSDINFCVQKEQRGTADALRAFYASTPNADKLDYVLIMCADTPLLTSETLSQMMTTIKNGNKLGVAASFFVEQPKGYGRIIRDDSREGFQIIEEKDASETQRRVKEVNSGLYLLKNDYVMKNLSAINSENESGEFYLTDLFQFDQKIECLAFDHHQEFLGVNNLWQLAESEKVLTDRRVRDLCLQGVRFLRPDRVEIDDFVEIEAGAEIGADVKLEGSSRVLSGAVIENGCVIKNSVIGQDSKILGNSYIEDAEIGKSNQIGPFARIRPGSRTSEDVKIGNFVETKKAHFEKGAKASHLSYLGDCRVGEESNIGCGFVTCNYDGAEKHFTDIGAGVFIGSDSQAVAPVQIGDGCYIAAGSTINQNMPDGSFAVARARQVTKEGMAKRFIKKKK